MEIDAVVVGGGIGGTALAALLSKRMNVLLVEKNEEVGGFCGRVVRNGFQFDFAIHIFPTCERGCIGYVSEQIGRWIDFIHADGNLIRIKIGDMESSFPPAGFTGRDGWIKAHENFLRSFGVEMSSGACRMIDLLWEGDAGGDAISALSSVGSRLIDILPPVLWAHLFYVAPAWKVNASIYLRDYRRMFSLQNSGYPRGGAFSIPRTFADAVNNVRTGTTVRRIAVDDGEVEGVELSDGDFIPCRIVASNIGARETVELVGEKHFPRNYVRTINSIRNFGFDGQEIVRIALDRRVTDLQCMWFLQPPVSSRSVIRRLMEAPAFLLKPASKFVDAISSLWYDLEIYRAVRPRFMKAWIVSPTNFDPSLAPRGKQIIQALGFRGSTYDAVCEAIPDVRDHTIWYESLGLKQLEERCGKRGSPPIYAPPVLKQPEISPRTPIKGLYLVGDCAGHGVGAEMAVNSAIACEGEIIEDLRSEGRI